MRRNSDRPPDLEGRLNLVVVLSDAMRAASLPFYGYPRETAPYLTALAEESLIFEDHLASYPGTPFSVSQMFTGRFSPPMLMDASFVIAPVRALEEDLFVLPRELEKAGFQTAIVTSHPWFNERAGVLEFFGYQALVPPRAGEAYAPMESLAPPIEEFLDTTAEPFFLYVHSMDTHSPYRVHAGFEAFQGVRGWPGPYNLYDSEILYTDHWVGWLSAELRRRGLLKRTLFVFTSDHGEELGEMGRDYWNWSHGYTLRRVQLHVPLLVRLPGGRPSGRVAETTRHLDLGPTLFELVHPESELEGFRLDGASLARRIGRRGWRPGPAAMTPAFTWRYWALHRGDRALHYDQWTDRYELYQSSSGPLNYPVEEPLEDPELRAMLEPELTRLYRRSVRELTNLPPSHEHLASIVIGVPGTVDSPAETAATYRFAARDDLWTIDPGRLLAAAPGEEPPPLVLSTPWSPGIYRVKVRLAKELFGLAVENRFRLRVLSPDGPVRQVEGGEATDGVLDLGLHPIGKVLRVEVSDPQGGVAVTGFVLELQGGDSTAGAADEELEERLRALGYVH